MSIIPTGKTVIINILLDQNMILLLLAIDPLGRFGLILQHFLFDIKLTSPLTFMPSNLMPSWCNPNLCASQAQKESSIWPITIRKLHNHAISTVTCILPQSPLSPHANNLSSQLQKKSHSISVMLHIHFMTTLFPLRPRANLIHPILVSSAGRSRKKTSR